MQFVPTSTTLAIREEIFDPEGQTATPVPGRVRRLDSRGVPARPSPVGAVVHRIIRSRCSVRAAVPTSKASVDISNRSAVPGATIARRLCTIACFYRYTEEESPHPDLTGSARAPPVPRLRVACHGPGPQRDRRDVGRGRVGKRREHALVSLLALNGLRVSEATGADIERLGLERGHRTLTILRKGGKIVTIPRDRPAQRVLSTSPLANVATDRSSCGSDGERLDRHAASRIVRRIARRAGIAKRVGTHTLRHAFITAALDAGVPLRDVQEAVSHADPRTTMRYDRARCQLAPARHLHRRHIPRRRRPIRPPPSSTSGACISAPERASCVRVCSLA